MPPGGRPSGVDMHPAGAAAGDAMAQMMAAGGQQQQQQHPASVGGLPGTLLLDHRWGRRHAGLVTACAGC
jgi:hypothetical protein